MSLGYEHNSELVGNGLVPVRRLTWEEIRTFCHELRAITEGGFPMVPAIASLARDLRQPRLKAVLEGLLADLEQGQSLEYALDRQAGRFPPVMIALIRAGEAAGNLAGVLALMSTHAQNMCRVTRNIRTALVYPLILVLTSAAVFGYLLVWVIPTFQATFAALGIEPTGLTRALFQVSGFWRGHGLALAAGGLAAVVLGWLLIRALTLPGSRRYAQGLLLLALPWYGRIYHAILQARFSRTLHLMLQSRVPAVDAILLAGAATGSPVAERAAGAASVRVAEGERLADALRQTGFFSHKFCWLLGAGEDRGGVEDALEHIADNIERELEGSEEVFGALLAPLITVAVAGVVGLLLVALYVPLYGAGKSLGVE